MCHLLLVYNYKKEKPLTTGIQYCAITPHQLEILEEIHKKVEVGV